MPGSLRVAVASNNSDQVDGHYGSCTRFLVYQVAKDDLRLIDVRSTAACDEAEDKNTARAQLISDCHVVYMQSIGGPAAAKVIRAGVHPIKWPAAGAAEAALGKLQESIAKPPPWLARTTSATPSARAREAWKDSPPERLAASRSRPVHASWTMIDRPEAPPPLARASLWRSVYRPSVIARRRCEAAPVISSRCAART